MIHDSVVRTGVPRPLLLMALLVLCTGWLPLRAQTLFTAENSALGGGGTAYVTGFEANFINPANLFLSPRIYESGDRATVRLGVGGFTGYIEPVWSGDGLPGYADYLEHTLGAYATGNLAMDNEVRQEILRSQYDGQNNTSQNMYRTEALLLGYHRQTAGSAFSLALRARQGMRTVTGRGWYSPRYNEDIRDLSLLKQKETLYELSAGFAGELSFVDGLWPSVNRLVAGIAPKVVLGGAYMDLFYDARYRQGTDLALNPFEYTYRHHSSGPYSEMFRRYRATGEVDATIDQTIREYNSLTPAGYGMGIDLGLTYLIPLDHPLPAREAAFPGSGNVLQIGVSITDLGVMRYSDQPLNVAVEPDQAFGTAQGIATSYFTGSEGQLLEFYERMNDIPNPLSNPDSITEEEITTSLPTAFNTGVMLRLNGIRLMGDLSIGLSDTPFNTRQLTAHFGLEFRPVPAVPIRAGTQLASGRPVHWMLGTGLQTGRFELLLSARFLSRPGDVTPLFSGAGFGGLRLRF